MRELAVAKVNDDDERHFYVFACRLNSRQHPIHLARVRKLKNHLVDDAIDPDRARHGRHRGVRWHLRNKTLRIKLAQLVVTNATGHHGYVVHVRIRHHRLECVVSVACREFIFHMIIPALRQRLLC